MTEKTVGGATPKNMAEKISLAEVERACLEYDFFLRQRGKTILEGFSVFGVLMENIGRRDCSVSEWNEKLEKMTIKDVRNKWIVEVLTRDYGEE